ncbi:2-oxoglutarate and iron-dependent oxygenase domain-containing protein [Nonomuraea sp. NPDC026600]|uniref:isopenicillin N synthase family dioxygenase n=1 Tax=Nonomuraea sp. NPDC026600 TaxID=3155363 RepID=UPI00340ACA6D
MIPVIDLQGESVPERVDAALREFGFLLITGHGVPAELRSDVRRAAKRFFALPGEVKERYAATVGERGWLPPGVEANGYAEGTPTPPDLKETFAVGADRPIGHPRIDREWFLQNVWPPEVPELEPLVTAYLTQMRALADRLLLICARALGVEEDFFTSRADHPTFTMNINRYPPLSQIGPPEPGQFRIGPHTDFGTVTILDRQLGVGGLQVFTLDGEWIDAPYVPNALTINIGDLLARWTGERWRSTRHRVLPPAPSAPDEELVSLIYFYECNPLTEVVPLTGDAEPVVASDYLMEKLRAITL